MNKIFKKSNSNNLEKIILNKKSDLINIPIQQLRTAQLKILVALYLNKYIKKQF